jgi:heme a synthase
MVAPTVSASKSAVGNAAPVDAAQHRQKRFAMCTWLLLAYNILVILWGAVVRATGSGAGCGSHWPQCNGEVLPRAPSVATMIEFSHRATSGIALIATIAISAWAFRVYPARNQGRRVAVAATLFMLGEALIGAVLVLLALVAKDDSLKRVVSMSLHLTNTFFLLAALVAQANIASFGSIDLRSALLRPLAILCATVLPVGITGGIAALGDTVFPAKTLASGIARDFSTSAHIYERLRVFHPFVAVGATALVIVGVRVIYARIPGDSAAKTGAAPWVDIVTTVALAQVGWGLGNLLLLAPMVMQLGHLLLADILWISLLCFGYRVLRRAPATALTAARSRAQAVSGPRVVSSMSSTL